MSRAKWKGPFLNLALIKKKLNNSLITRNSAIPSTCNDRFLNIHTGKEFKKIFISKEKIGLKFGAFAYTHKNASKIKTAKKK